MARGRPLAHLDRSGRWKLALTTGVAAVLAGSLATAAHAGDEGLPAEGDYTAVYAGTLELFSDGESTGSSETTASVECRSETCTLTMVGKEISTARGPSMTFTSTLRENSPDCPPLVRVTTIVAEATAESLTYNETTPEVKASCGGGVTASALSNRTTFTGRLTEILEASSSPSAGDETPEASPASPTSSPAAPAGDDEVSVSQLDGGDAGSPSVLRALPRAQDLSVDAVRMLALAALVVILVLLIVFPTQLLNDAVDTGQEKLAAWRRRRRGEADPVPVLSARTWAIAAVLVLIASFIDGFVDPGFGANAGSVRVLISLFVALAVESLLVWFLVIWVTRRTDPDTVAGFAAAPVTLLVVAGAVLLTRLTGFEPGIVFGLVAGVTFAKAATAVKQGKVTLAGMGLVFVLAMVAWLAYSVLASDDPDPSFGTSLVTETLSSLAVAGIASLPLTLIPLRGLPGHAIYGWSRSAWAACYALGLGAFFFILMPMPFSWSAIDTPLRIWVLSYLAYAGAAVLAWAAITKPWAKGQDALDETATT